MYHFEPLDALLDALPKNYLIPAVDMKIIKDGEVIYRHSAGYSDKFRTKPVGNRDLYAMYSCTKVATCTGAMRLIEEGKLSLSDPVYRYLPAYKHLTVKEADGTVHPAENVMTVEHLMSMQGGLDYNLQRGNVQKVLDEKGPEAGTVDIVQTFPEAPLVFEPGTHFLYSLCHDVLAAVIEVASGMRYSDYLNEVIFAPLGMKDTTFHPTEEQKSRLSYLTAADYTLYEAHETDAKSGPTEAYESGGGGLFSTVDDYSELMYALANQGMARNGYRVLNPESVELLRSPRLSPVSKADFDDIFRQMTDYTYCLGVRRMVKTEGRVAPAGHFGWDGAAGSYVLADPENKIALMYAQNVKNSGITYSLLHGLLIDMAYLCMREPVSTR